MSGAPVHVVVMGVSGSGKSTVGAQLAARLGVRFIDGDSLHPAENVAKMRSGVPLDDGDRRPWLEVIGRTFADDGGGLVVACSALKLVYREAIRALDPGVVFVHLDGGCDLLRLRLDGRGGHFMPPSLLQSQLETLEPLREQEAGLVLDIAAPPEELAEAAARWLAPGAA